MTDLMDGFDGLTEDELVEYVLAEGRVELGELESLISCPVFERSVCSLYLVPHEDEDESTYACSGPIVPRSRRPDTECPYTP